MTKDNAKNPIAVFDSGVGGISVLKEMCALMPRENFIFFGDSKNAPYGEKSTEEVYRLTAGHVEHFLLSGAKAIVLACNTATSAAAKLLREKYPDVPIIGLEPALKPAVLWDYEKPDPCRILVLATPLTLREEKFLKLTETYKDCAQVIPLPAPDLVRFVENGLIGTEEIYEYLSGLLAPYKENKIDSVVLGCTHFPFAKEDIKKVLGPDTLFFDGAYGAAKELRHQLEINDALAPADSAGSVRFLNSDMTQERLQLCRTLFDMKI